MELDEPAAADRLKRLLARAQWRAVLPFIAVAALLLIAVASLGHEIEHHLKTIEAWVAAQGAWGVVALVVLLAAGTSLLVPESLFAVAAGALFGLAWGVSAALAGNLLAAALQYALSRGLLRERIDRTLAARPSLAAIQRAAMRDELRLQVLLRLTPLNPAMISYMLGAAGVRFPGFLLACLAMTPHVFLEVYLGHAGKHLAEMLAGGRAAEMQELAIFGGLVLAAAVILTVSRVAHRAVLLAAHEGRAAPTAT